MNFFSKYIPSKKIILFTSSINLHFSNGVENYSEKEIPILRYISTHYKRARDDCQYCEQIGVVYLRNLTNEYEYVHSVKIVLQTDNYCSFAVNGSWRFYNTWNGDSYNQFCWSYTKEYTDINFDSNTYFTMRAQDDGRNWVSLEYWLTITLKSK